MQVVILTGFLKVTEKILNKSLYGISNMICSKFFKKSLNRREITKRA